MPSTCIVCQANSDELPLLKLHFQKNDYYICPQHLPILIHKPDQLVGRLPGAEHLQPQEHDRAHE